MKHYSDEFRDNKNPLYEYVLSEISLEIYSVSSSEDIEDPDLTWLLLMAEMIIDAYKRGDRHGRS